MSNISFVIIANQLTKSCIRDPEPVISILKDVGDNKPAITVEETLAEINEWSYLVNNLADDHPYMNDPECIIDWEHVQRVVVDPDVGEVDRCPVCLETPPIAPRLSKCGHVFCLMCILRYMAEVSAQCPFCLDRLYILKPMIYRLEGMAGFQVGQTVDLELVGRSKHGVHVVSTNSGVEYSNRATWNHGHSRYSPLFHADRSVLIDMFLDEQRAIEKLRDSLQEHEKPEYCDRALQEIRIEMEHLMGQQGVARTQDASMDDCHHDSLYYYFYQPRTNYRTFLANEDIKILLKRYKHYHAFPPKLTTTIKSVDIIRLDARLRGKYRYLDHLPLGTALRFIRCEF